MHVYCPVVMPQEHSAFVSQQDVALPSRSHSLLHRDSSLVDKYEPTRKSVIVTMVKINLD